MIEFLCGFLLIVFAISGSLFMIKELLPHVKHRRTATAANGSSPNGTSKSPTGRTGRAINPYPVEGASSRKALPRAGIEVGEIICWRVWLTCRSRGHYLTGIRGGMGDRVIWRPGVPMTGEPGDYDKVGVYGWKTIHLAEKQVLELGGGIIGRVALWGEVVEHELGYRAQYGKIISLDLIGPPSLKNREPLMTLRKIYAVEGQPPIADMNTPKYE